MDEHPPEDDWPPGMVDSEDDEAANDAISGLITRPKSFAASATAFASRPYFVPAVREKGKPRQGGTVSGYVFGTRTEGTGYFRDTTSDREAQCAPDTQADHRSRFDSVCAGIPTPTEMTSPLMQPPGQRASQPASQDNANILTPQEWTTQRTCRRKHIDGKRNRRKKKTASDGSTILSITTVKDKSARNAGFLTIDSWNMNAWQAGLQAASDSSADIILLQETKVDDTERCRRAEEAAKRLGWQATLSKAVTTSLGGASAGVAIMAKKHIGLRARETSLVAAPFQSRLHHAWVGAGKKGGIHVLSMYLWTSEGMTERNRAVLLEAERVTRLLRGCWCIGGDCSLPPRGPGRVGQEEPREHPLH